MIGIGISSTSRRNRGRVNRARGSGDPSNATFWPASTVQNGITATRTVVTRSDGLPAVQVRYQGTATSTFHNQVYNETQSRTPALVGQVWTPSVILQRVAGSVTGVAGLFLTVIERNSAGVLLFQSQTTSYNGTTEVTRSVSRTLSSPTVATASTAIALEITNGATIDITFEIAALQLEQGPSRTRYQAVI